MYKRLSLSLIQEKWPITLTIWNIAVLHGYGCDIYLRIPDDVFLVCAVSAMLNMNK